MLQSWFKNHFLISIVIIIWLLVVSIITFSHYEPLIHWQIETQIIVFRFLCLLTIIAVFLRKEIIELFKYPKLLIPMLFLTAINQTTFLLNINLTTPLDAFVLAQSKLLVPFSKLSILEAAVNYNLISFLTQCIWATWIYRLLEIRFYNSDNFVQLNLKSKIYSFFIRFGRMVAALFLGWLSGLIVILPLTILLIFEYGFYIFVLLALASGFLCNVITTPLLFTVSLSSKKFFEAIGESFVLGKKHWKKWLMPLLVLYFVAGAFALTSRGITPQNTYIWWNVFFEFNVTETFFQQFKWLWIWGSSGFSELHLVFMKSFDDLHEPRLFLITSLGMNLLTLLVQINIAKKLGKLVDKSEIEK